MRHAMVKKTIPIGLTILVLAAAMAPLWAAPRTVCFRLKLRDDRWNCSTSGESGARRPCNQGGYVAAEGHQYQLWDKDNSSDDEYIGTWHVGGPGTRCATFEWENASYSKGESHPDVYMRYINRVNRTGYSNYVRVRAVDTDGSSHVNTTWRNGQSGDPDRYVARNCAAGGSCFMYSSGSLVPTNDIASERGLWVMALDSAQHALQAFGEVMDTHLDMHYPGKAACSTSCADSRDEIHITQSRGNNGFNVAHEVGHVVQMQEFNQDWLRDDCTLGGGNSWNLTSNEYDSCATTEGWASFIGVTSWYEPNNNGSVPIGWGLDFETAALTNATCANNAGRALQVAKAFWDLDDFNNEAGQGAAAGDDDRVSYNSLDIARGWRQFPNGSGNRDDGESDRDGVNVRDYWGNNSGRFTAAGVFETLLEHNCLQSQDNG